MEDLTAVERFQDRIKARWNPYVEGPGATAGPRDVWIADHLYPLIEAAAASFGIRVPEPWDRNPRPEWVRYWRTALLWALLRFFTRTTLRPPLGLPRYWYIEPGGVVFETMSAAWYLPGDRPVLVTTRRVRPPVRPRRIETPQGWRAVYRSGYPLS